MNKFSKWHSFPWKKYCLETQIWGIANYSSLGFAKKSSYLWNKVQFDSSSKEENPVALLSTDRFRSRTAFQLTIHVLQNDSKLNPWITKPD